MGRELLTFRMDYTLKNKYLMAKTLQSLTLSIKNARQGQYIPRSYIPIKTYNGFLRAANQNSTRRAVQI